MKFPYYRPARHTPMRSDRGCKFGKNYYYPECRSPFFISPRWGRVHNSCKRLSSARAARSPAFHAGVTCKSLHRNWGTCRHGRQRGTSQADGEKGPNLNRGKTATFAPERDGTLSRVFPPISRGPSRRLFLHTLRDRLLYVCGKRKQCAAIVYDYPYIHILVRYM